MPRRRRRRGYPAAVMIGIRGLEAVTWEVYSESVKRGQKIGEASPYKLYEAIVDVVRPLIKQGVKTILVASTDEKKYASFIRHVERHQSWLLKGWELNKAVFEHLPMAAMDEHQVREIVKTNGFKKRVLEASSVDMRHVMEILEERLNDPDGIETLLFSLDEIESHIYGGGEAEFVIVTNQFHEKYRRRTHRLLQVATNNSTQTIIVLTDTDAGVRLTQFDEIVCLIKAS